MKIFFAVTFFLFNSFIVLAQSKSKWTYGISANPVFCFTLNTADSKDIVSSPNHNQTFSAFNDSINKNKSYRLTYLNVTGWINYSIDLNWTLQFGAGYKDIGFQINQNNIHFNDKLYPGVGSGILEEKTNAPRNIAYDYRYHYLHLPVFINYHLYRSADFRSNFYLSGGLALDFLLKHQITANLDFNIDGKNSFYLDSSGYNGRFMAVNIMVGARWDYRIDKNYSFMLQPVFGLSPLPITTGPINVYPFYFSIQTGFTYEIAN